MNRQKFWKIMMTGSILGWVFIFWGALFPFADGPVKIVWICILLAWAILHPLELVKSMPIGKEKGLWPGQIFVKTMLFGFTWWVPLKLGVFDS